MLHELRVENLLLMERAELTLAPGLNILTGETGAGKTLLAHALDLLLGGRGELPTDAGEIVLARRVWPDGRTRAYVCGRSATLADLQELGAHLISFYGQHEHRKLMLSAAQLDVLDAYCGATALKLRTRIGASHEHVRDLQERVAELGRLAGAQDRELDLLAFELEEI